MIRGIALSAPLAFMLCAAFGQSEAPASFEVASIKEHKGQYMEVSALWSGPRLRITAYGLTGLIMDAYHVQNDAILGRPDWSDTTRFDIEALAGGDAAPPGERAELMLQSLLADRFKLKVHRETRMMPVYDLVVQKGGPKLKESAPDEGSSLNLGAGRVVQLIVVKGGMDQLATQLSGTQGVDRPVRNKTGLTGTYDYTLRWWPEYGGPSTNADSISVFTALQEQLGLKLESQKGPVEVLVVDHVEKPTGN